MCRRLLLYLLFAISVTSNSLRTHGLSHTRVPCPLLSPKACSNSCPLSQWCHPTISSSVIPFSSCPQSFPASWSFPVSRLFASGGQGIGASASVFPMNIQDWVPLGWTGLISLQSKGLSRVFSNTTVQKHEFFGTQTSLWLSSHIYTWQLEKTALTRWTFVGKIMSLLSNMLSRFVIAFLPRNKCLLISWLQSPSALIFEAPQNKVCHCFHRFPSICHEVMGPDAMTFVFWMLSFKSAFSLSSFTFNKRLLVPPAYLRLLIFLLIPPCGSSKPSILNDVLYV